MNRRHFIKAAACASLTAGCRAVDLSAGTRPVILATDIGDDIDDTWALGFLLRCPELNLKLVATEYGKAPYRAKLLAKFLETTGNSHIPIAVGPDVEPRGVGPLAEWVRDYDLSSYPGRVHTDGVGAMVDVIMNSPEPVTLICIGPMPNVAAALDRMPAIAKHARFVGMDGSIRLGYGGAKTPCAEWNIKADPQAAKIGLSAPWDITITPLDTCGLVVLDGDRYQRILHSRNPIATTIVENYRVWSKGGAEHHSSTLFDPVAVYLAMSQGFCKMERLGVRVTDDGMTVLDDRAKPMNVATEWNDLDGFRDLLTNRICGGF
ncbi:MAG TPA: nucleoside hydrolase [Verrucomicrobiae bacterium]|jgi:inosine-uridine nucleoside N-ribohydrolase|nr:nucleoside hydrolase [Verrucomicrobiae bacterium]